MAGKKNPFLFTYTYHFAHFHWDKLSDSILSPNYERKLLVHLSSIYSDYALIGENLNKA